VLSARQLRRPAAEAWELRLLAAEAQGVRQLAAEAQGVRRLAAEAQGVRQLVAEAQGVRQLAAEARALQRAAQAWQVWPAQASAYLFRAGLARPRSPMPIPRVRRLNQQHQSRNDCPSEQRSRDLHDGVPCLQGNHDARMSHAFNRDPCKQQDSSEASSGARPLKARRLSQTAS
jgi:hypothetical protein